MNYDEKRGRQGPRYISSGHRKYRNQAEYEEDFPRLVAEGREKYLLWEAVPFFWFETGKRLGLINLAEGEWDQYLKICGEMAEGEERRETRKRRPMSSGTDPSPDSVAKRTEMLAGKMAAYDYLILKKTQHA